MTVREDERLGAHPPAPVRCTRCTAEVQVRKASWQQTSIQWDARSAALCEEYTGHGRAGTCGALREAIAAAALDGSLAVPDEDGATAPGREEAA